LLERRLAALGSAARNQERSLLRARIIIVALLSTACTAVLTVHAGAIVPPRNCGTLDAKGKRYNIKSDQIRCRTARTYARRYLIRERTPRGYRCRNYGRQTRIRFRCSRGIKVLFAIRR